LFGLFGIFYRNGYFAVQLFWGISGLVLSHSYMNTSDPSWRSFFWARFSRLYPLHLITLVVVACLQFANWYLSYPFRIYQINDARHFILNLFFIQSWGLESGHSFNAPTWSVSVEIAVYLLYFLSIPLLKQTRLVGALALLGVWSITTDFLGEVFFHECLGYFLAGIAVWFATSSRSLLKSLVGGFFVTVLSIYILSGNGISSITGTLMIVLFTSALLDRSRFLIHGRFLKRFGELTYSVFLWHIPVQLLIILTFERASISKSVFETAPFLIFYLVLVYGIANISFVYIESPLKRIVLNRVRVKTE
jgi:peptidoglycan/LPS O-acetylase OafA/YrhL